MRNSIRIENPTRAKQLVDFFNMRMGNKSLTDLDGLMEWEDKFYVLVEVKHVNANGLPDGQKLALERLTDDLQKAKPALLIIATHDTPAEQMIDLASCPVHSYRYNGRWLTPQQPMTVKRLVVTFIELMKRKV